ncbi:MAG: hypothetical protein WD231_03210 [Candidatus Woykebacteria bacterium]
MNFTRINQKGIGIISLIIIVAFLYGALTAYSFYNPSFNLSKYTPVYFLRNFNDDNRKEDLLKIANALEAYYEENRELPGQVGFCGRIVTITIPEAKDALSPYFPSGIPQDPANAGTGKDYFYLHKDRNTYVLLAVLENPPEGSTTYNYEDCHDWPGDNVYNYKVSNE